MAEAVSGSARSIREDTGVKHYGQLFIDGGWAEPLRPGTRTLIDPTTEEAFATVASGGGAHDVDLAVVAARRAFEELLEDLGRGAHRSDRAHHCGL